MTQQFRSKLWACCMTALGALSAHTVVTHAALDNETFLPAIHLLLEESTRTRQPPIPHTDIACRLKQDGGLCDVLPSLSSRSYTILDQNLAGKMVCLAPHADLKGIAIGNVQGTANDPVTVVNCDGQVVLDSTGWSNGVWISKSRYITFSGAGSSEHFYGFVQKNSNDRGIDVRDGSSDVEISYTEIRDSRYAGLTMRSYPFANGTCKPEFSRANFTQYNTVVHHTKISNTGAEAMYLGTSHYHDPSSTPCPDLQQASLINVKVHDNIVLNSQTDGIQIGGAVSGVDVHDNQIINYGIANIGAHGSGLQINGGTNGDFYRNTLIAADGASNTNSIQYVGGEGALNVFNNLLLNTPRAMMSLNKMDNTTHMRFINNTVVGSAQGGGTFLFFCNKLDGVQDYVIKNNIVTHYEQLGVPVFENFHTYFNGSDGSNCPFNGVEFRGQGSVDELAIAGNLFSKLLAPVKFLNANTRDYRLRSDSPAVDSGENMSALFNDDAHKTVRDSQFDMGALEHSTSPGKSLHPVTATNKSEP